MTAKTKTAKQTPSNKGRKTPPAAKGKAAKKAASSKASPAGGKTPASTLYTVVTMLPNLAPHGATVKRARSDPVGDSDLFVFNLDAFHQAANDFASCVPVDVIESVADLVGKRV